jgi:GNAT superfamily N-acetyltransferase
VELRARTDDDLDECERLARAVHRADGYPPRCANDLRAFISAPGALGAWVLESDMGIVGHVVLLPATSREVMALACEVTERSADQLCVVARLFVAPSARGQGLGSRLLAAAADAGLARGRWPILDVAAHLRTAIQMYEKAGWGCAGPVTVEFPGEEPLEELVYVSPAPDGVPVASRAMARKS